MTMQQNLIDAARAFVAGGPVPDKKESSND